MISKLHTIGILGGSFDPVHRAHLALADAFAEALELDELRFMPAGKPWQKQNLDARAEHRLKMLELALNEEEMSAGARRCVFTIDTRELARAGPTYTVDTLVELRKEVGPKVSLILLLGADQLLRLDTWRRWHELWSLAHIAVATRPGSALKHLHPELKRVWDMRNAGSAALHTKAHGHSYLLEGFDFDISATSIRASLANTKAQHVDGGLEALVAQSVLSYIARHQLYSGWKVEPEMSQPGLTRAEAALIPSRPSQGESE